MAEKKSDQIRRQIAAKCPVCASGQPTKGWTNHKGPGQEDRLHHDESICPASADWRALYCAQEQETGQYD